MARVFTSPSAQAIDNDAFFVDPPADGLLTGAVNGVNKVYTLPYTPSDDEEVELYINGQLATYTDDYSVSGTTLTTVEAWETGTIFRVRMRRSVS